MGSFAKTRSVLTAVLAALLIVAAVSGECVACGTAMAASAQSGDCCNPNGHCKASPYKDSSRCVNERPADFVVGDQLGQVAPVLPDAEFCAFFSPESAPNGAILLAFHADYSPPEHHILHSALLI
jgi:hypothetical protein